MTDFDRAIHRASVYPDMAQDDPHVSTDEPSGKGIPVGAAICALLLLGVALFLVTVLAWIAVVLWP